MRPRGSRRSPIPRSSEGFYRKPMRMGSGPREGGGSSSSEGLVPSCSCGAWHYATNVGEPWWSCVACGKRLERVYGMILERQACGSTRPGM